MFHSGFNHPRTDTWNLQGAQPLATFNNTISSNSLSFTIIQPSIFRQVMIYSFYSVHPYIIRDQSINHKLQAQLQYSTYYCNVKWNYRTLRLFYDNDRFGSKKSPLTTKLWVIGGVFMGAKCVQMCCTYVFIWSYNAYDAHCEKKINSDQIWPFFSVLQRCQIRIYCILSQGKPRQMWRSRTYSESKSKYAKWKKLFVRIFSAKNYVKILTSHVKIVPRIIFLYRLWNMFPGIYTEWDGLQSIGMRFTFWLQNMKDICCGHLFRLLLCKSDCRPFHTAVHKVSVGCLRLSDTGLHCTEVCRAKKTTDLQANHAN